MARVYSTRKRILVTGGAGFLGSHLIDRLLAEDNEIICCDNLFTGSKLNFKHLADNPHFEFIRHDVTNPLSVEVDEIYNLACPASPVHYQHDPIQTMKTSVIGAMNMLDLAKRLQCRIFQASTSEVYGDPAVSSADRVILGERQSHRRPLLLRRGQALRRNAVFRLRPEIRRRHQGRADFQHLWAADASGGRPRGVQLHYPGAPRRAPYALWRRRPDPVLLLRRRPHRRFRSADGQSG